MAEVNDVVLLYLEDTPVSFARVESILPDSKKDWYQIKLLLLKIPLQTVTWILKDDYITGGQFHMNGKKMKLKKVESPVEDMPFSSTGYPPSEKIPENGAPKEGKQAQIISFPGQKKDHDPESG